MTVRWMTYAWLDMLICTRHGRILLAIVIRCMLRLPCYINHSLSLKIDIKCFKSAYTILLNSSWGNKKLTVHTTNKNEQNTSNMQTIYAIRIHIYFCYVHQQHTRYPTIDEWHRHTMYWSKAGKKKVLEIYVLFIFPRKKRIFTFYGIVPLWHETGSRNSFSCKTRTCLLYIANIMAADESQGIRNHDIYYLGPD